MGGDGGVNVFAWGHFASAAVSEPVLLFKWLNEQSSQLKKNPWGGGWGVNGFVTFLVIHVCPVALHGGGPDQKPMIFRHVQQVLPVWVSLCTWPHAGMITPWLLWSTQPSLHLFKCPHSYHSLFAKCIEKKKHSHPPTITMAVAKLFAYCISFAEQCCL